jgi:hypothetical protein
MLLYLKNAESAKQYRYHIILAKDDNDNVVGGGIFDYFMGTNSGIIEFIAIKSDLQSSGVGTLIYTHILNVMEYDAYKAHKKKLDYVCCEIDAPGYNKLNNDKYLHFWNKQKFSRLDFTYVQPSLSPLQSAVHGLWFIIAPQASDLPEVQGEFVAKIIYDYLKYAMQIDDPETHPDYIKMKNELLSNPVKTLPII